MHVAIGSLLDNTAIVSTLPLEMTVGFFTSRLLGDAVLQSFRPRNAVGVEVGVVRVNGVYALRVVHHVDRVELVHLLHEIRVDLRVLTLLLLLGLKDLLGFFDQLLCWPVASAIIEALDGLVLAGLEHVAKQVDDCIIFRCCRVRLDRYILGQLPIVALVIAREGVIDVMRLP